MVGASVRAHTRYCDTVCCQEQNVRDTLGSHRSSPDTKSLGYRNVVCLDRSATTSPNASYCASGFCAAMHFHATLPLRMRTKQGLGRTQSTVVKPSAKRPETGAKVLSPRRAGVFRATETNLHIVSASCVVEKEYIGDGHPVPYSLLGQDPPATKEMRPERGERRSLGRVGGG